jgi:hypothetical protein
MDNWQAFGPGTGGSSEQPSPPTVPAGPDDLEPAPAGTAAPPPGLVPPMPALTGQEERARTLSLIDFLADYDARRNPPVYDLNRSMTSRGTTSSCSATPMCPPCLGWVCHRLRRLG